MTREEDRRHRVFIALPVQFPATDEFVMLAKTLEKNVRSLKVVSSEQYHITLKFLGHIDDEKLSSMKGDFDAIPLPSSPLPYRIKGTGAFPGLKNPSVFWCGIETDIHSIRKIHNDVETLSEKHGFAREKRGFTPHLTIARIKHKSSVPHDLIDFFQKHGSTHYGESAFNHISIYESSLTPRGPVYGTIAAREFR